MQRSTRPALASVAFVLALALAACGSDSDAAPGEVDAPPIRPVSEIIEGDITVSRLEATSAVIEVETTIDVVCAVVFGTDTTYGRIATDLDMGGAAHSHHAAPLRALEPDTVYHFRLQGSGPDGTLYVGEDMTFRTPPADPDAALPGTNLASAAEGARVVEVSSVFADAPAWAGEHAIDGDPSTEWSSDGDGDDAYITIELRERTPIGSVGLWTRTMGTSAEIARFQVVTEDGVVLGPFDVPGAAGMHTYEVDVEAQVLRFEVVESSGGNTGVVTLGAFAAE